MVNIGITAFDKIMCFAKSHIPTKRFAKEKIDFFQLTIGRDIEVKNQFKIERGRIVG